MLPEQGFDHHHDGDEVVGARRRMRWVESMISKPACAAAAPDWPQRTPNVSSRGANSEPSGLAAGAMIVTLAILSTAPRLSRSLESELICEPLEKPRLVRGLA